MITFFQLRRWVLRVAVLLMAVSSPLQAQTSHNGETTVHAIGVSRVRGGDISAARQEAISSGLVAAVHGVVADLLPPETVTGNFQAINEAVLNHTDRFVRDYRVLVQSTLSANYRAVVQATISVDRIKEALRDAGIRLEARQYPRVLFCIAETRANEPSPRYWWDGRSGRDETTAGMTLSRTFEEEGFPVIPFAGAVVTANYPPQLRGTEAVALGRELKAEVVVVGFAAAEAAGYPEGREASSIRGTLSARAYRVSDGGQIAQTQRAVLATSDDTQHGSRDALHRAALLAAEDMIGQINAAWFMQMAAGTRIDMTVLGISGQMANFVRFRGALGNISGVERLQIREMQSDTAMLSVDYRGHVRALADALLLLDFDAFRITIAQVSDNAIHLQLVPR